MSMDAPATEETAAQDAAAPDEEKSAARVPFSEFDLPDDVALGLNDLGYAEATDVQAAVFAPVREGNDVLVQSRTGSGKTTAFCLPVIVGLDGAQRHVQAVALCPTRELAVQVSREATSLARHTGVKVAAIYGGASINAQIDQLKAGVQFVVGTPGRVLDLIRRGHLKLNQVQYAVLDEADEMLSMGFWEEVTSILNQMPKTKRTLLFSATLPAEIERAAAKYLRDPVRIDLSRDSINVDTIVHILHEADDKMSRPRNFLYVLERHRPTSAIVFCNRRDETELVTRYLQRFGFRCEALNGDMAQSARERVLARVKSGELDMMVATDVAARGIDISDLGHVFNYDLPEYDEVYVHRVGRTGRIGKKGTAVSLVRGKYLTNLSSIRKQFNVPFQTIPLPPEEEILKMQAERMAAQLVEEADGVEIDQYRPVAEAMLERGDVKEILAFLLRTHYSVSRRSSTGARAPDEGRSDDRGRGGRERDGRDRGRGRGRDRDERDEAPADDDGPVSLYVTLGREDGIDDLMGLIEKLAAMAGVDPGQFTGRGDLRDTSSHVEVDRDVFEKVVEAVNGAPRPGYEAPPEEAAADDAQAAEAAGEDGDDRPAKKPRDRSTLVCERARPKRASRRPGRGRPRRRR